MLTSKIKNLIIWILLFVNLFLIGLTAADWMQTRRAERTVTEAVRTILASNGITMEQSRLPDTAGVKSYTVSRDFDREEDLAASVLGRLSAKEQQGGNIMYYRGERGEAIFRATGDFAILFTDRLVPISGSTVDTARSILRKMEIDGEFSPERSAQSGGVYTTVVMTCEYDGLPVVNAQIEFQFTSDSLMMVSGTRVLDVRREDPEFRPLDSATLLTRFVGLVGRNGYVCSELRDISPVYLVPDAGGGKLTPLWRIETDGSTYYLNLTTGEEQAVA